MARRRAGERGAGLSAARAGGLDVSHATADGRRAILRIENVNKTFEKQRVLKDLNLEIGDGEFLTLLGPSGCGKTTSLNLVAGLLQADSGRILLRGQPANELPPQRRGLGMVFQSWALFPHMNVFENIAYGLRMRRGGAEDIRRKVGAMLDLVRLPGIEHKFPSQLSGGMQQRVALARALVTEPDLLLLDEPLSNLDAALRKEMQVELKHIHERLKVSTLLVTHSQEEALVMSDRIAVMRSGRIQRIDTPQAIYSDPKSPFVCTFLGEANVFEGTVEAIGPEGAELRIGKLRLSAPSAANWRRGGQAMIAIRPEAIGVETVRPGSGAGGWLGEVTERIFKGSNVTYQVSLGERRIEVLGLPQASGRMFGIGERVGLSIPRESVIVLDPERDRDA